MEILNFLICATHCLYNFPLTVHEGDSINGFSFENLQDFILGHTYSNQASLHVVL